MRIALTILLAVLSVAAQRPSYEQLRADEDWSALRDESKRTDRFDRLKYLSLGRDGWFATLGGEIRPYYEFIENENWGSSPRDPNGWLLQRYMFHADLRFGRRFRVFAQLKSGFVNNRRGGPRPPDLDKLDFHQLFAEFGVFRDAKLRIGRQELSFGSSRLVATREGPNVRQAFDGVRLSAKFKGWKLDGFVVKPVSTSRGYFDDRPLHDQTFAGVYAVRRGVLTKNDGIDLYYLDLRRKSARFFQGTGEESRRTFGARFWNASSALDYNFEAVVQTGTFGARKIGAWTLASDTGYTFRRSALKPRAGLKIDRTSGDRDPNDAKLGTFNALFPKGGYFGQLSPIGPYNHTDVHVSFRVKPLQSVTVTADWINFWRTRKADGIYNVAGVLLRPARPSASRYVGAQAAVETSWQLDSHTTLSLNYSRFAPGGSLRAAPPSESTNYLAAWATFRF